MGQVQPVVGPNAAWDDEAASSGARAAAGLLFPTEEQLAEFYERMHPLTRLNHEVAGRASLFPNGEVAGDMRLRPTFMLHGDAGHISPESMGIVLSRRADCFFHTHPAVANHADCWPSIADLSSAFNLLKLHPHICASLVVTHCGLVVIARHPTTFRTIRTPHRLHEQTIVDTLRGFTQLNLEGLQREAAGLGLDVRMLFASGDTGKDAQQQSSTLSSAPVFVHREYDEFMQQRAQDHNPFAFAIEPHST